MQLLIFGSHRALYILSNYPVNLIHVLPHYLNMLFVPVSLLSGVQVELCHLFQLILEVFLRFIATLQLSPQLP